VRAPLSRALSVPRFFSAAVRVAVSPSSALIPSAKALPPS